MNKSQLGKAILGYIKDTANNSSGGMPVVVKGLNDEFGDVWIQELKRCKVFDEFQRLYKESCNHDSKAKEDLAKFYDKSLCEEDEEKKSALKAVAKRFKPLTEAPVKDDKPKLKLSHKLKIKIHE